MSDPATPKLNNPKAYVAALVPALITLGALQLGVELPAELVEESQSFVNELLASLAVGITTGLGTWLTRAFPKPSKQS